MYTILTIQLKYKFYPVNLAGTGASEYTDRISAGR